VSSILATSEALLGKRQRTEARIPLNIDRDPGEKQLRIGRKYVATTFDAGNVDQMNLEFVEVLTRICDEVAAQGETLKPLSAAGLARYGEELRDTGSLALSMIPNEVGGYLQTREAAEAQRGISVDFSFEESLSFLWEMMYQGDPAANFDWKNFWGFRFPMGHLYWDTDTPSTIRVHRGLFASTHDELRNSRLEVEGLEKKFEELRQRFQLNINVERLESALTVEALDGCEAQLVGLFTDEDFRYGVVHFACHCDNVPGATGGSGNVTRAYLAMTAHKRTIELKLRELLKWKGKGFRHGPLVFLNACKSATPAYLLQAFGFPMTLLQFGAGGVIATACPVPDTFASAFATEFYRRLLDRQALHEYPTYVGEALLETRLHFLNEYNNPLGLAYGLYALSNQRLEINT